MNAADPENDPERNGLPEGGGIEDCRLIIEEDIGGGGFGQFICYDLSGTMLPCIDVSVSGKCYSSQCTSNLLTEHEVIWINNDIHNPVYCSLGEFPGNEC